MSDEDVVESNAPVSTITCDLEGRIETFNKGAEQIFGYTSDEVIGKKRVSAFSPGRVVLGHVANWLSTAVEEGKFESETTFVHKDGSLIAAKVEITPTWETTDGEKTQIGYCGKTRTIDKDATDERRSLRRKT